MNQGPDEAWRPDEASEIRLQVSDEELGVRLDRFVAARLDHPRNQVQQWIRDGHVEISKAHAKVKASTVLEPDMEVVCRVPAPSIDADLEPEDKPLAVLYEDEHVIAINKPSGLVVHPGAGRTTGTLVHRLLHHYPEVSRVGGRGRPGIVHRLDLHTTGVLLVARTELAYRELNRAFAERRVDKRYLAIVNGVPKTESGTIAQPIGRHRTVRSRMAVRSDGRPALTHYQVSAQVTPWVSRLRVDIESGRTHQIRVHMKFVGHPLVGDPVYGEARGHDAPIPMRRAILGFSRPALHAQHVALEHPVNESQRLSISAPIPDDLQQLWIDLGGSWDV